LDQNPAYYELLQEAAFKTGSEQNITEWLVKRAHRRYFGRTGSSGDDGAFDAHVAAAWGELARLGLKVYPLSVGYCISRSYLEVQYLFLSSSRYLSSSPPGISLGSLSRRKPP
jgi:hypothetical protein